MKKKVFRTNCFLSMQEYVNIKGYLSGRMQLVTINKEVRIIDGDSVYKFELKICGSNDTLGNVTLEIKNIYGINNSKLFVSEYNKISRLIGVKEFIHNDSESIFCFYFNLDKEYDERHYPYKYDYRKSKLNILAWGLKGKLRDVYLEIAYADFTKENELAQANYCLLVCPQVILNYESEIFDLYESKLRFIGLELCEIIDLIKIFNADEIYDKLENFNSRKDIFNLLIAYISFIKYSVSEIPERTDEELISKIGYKIYDKYIWLLGD